MANAIQNYRTKYEVKRQNRFYLIFPSDVGGDSLQASVVSSARPNFEVSEIELQHLNVRWWLSGKPNWSAWTCDFYDYLTDNTLQQMLKWYTKVYDIQTTKMSTPDNYKKDVVIQMLGPELEGDVVEQYKLFGAWPKTIDLGALNMTSEGTECHLGVTFRYDYAQLL